MHKGGQYIWDEMPSENKTILFSTYHKKNTNDKFLEDYEELKKIVYKKIPDPTAGFQFYFKVFILLLSTYYVDFIMDYGALRSVIQPLLYAWVGFNIGHDANHSAISNNWRINYLFSFSMDYVGISSYLWRLHHNYLHHVNTNNKDDPDYVAIMPAKRYQWLWIWFLLPFLAIKDHISQTRDLIFGKFKDNKGRAVAFFMMAAFIWRFYYLPLREDIWNIRWVMLSNGILGAYAGFFFLLSHHFVGNRPNKGDTWLRMQVENSSSVGGKWLCFINGGLNYQIEHHLFPKICHTYYPELAEILKKYCKAKKIRYNHFETIWKNCKSTCLSMKNISE